MIQYISDNHIHSNFSEDSNASMESMVKKAVEIGLSYITFTEHVDYNQNDYGYKYYNYDTYSKSIDDMQRKYKNDITILKGIEFGEPHIYQKEFEIEKNRDYDVILASIHWCNDLFYGEKALQLKYTSEEIMELYYHEVMKMVIVGGFDVVAHLDFPNRYFKTAKKNNQLVNKILEEIIKQEIVLEINSSGFRKGYLHTMPDDEVINKYVSMGGKNVSLGSDAHEAIHIAKDFNRIELIEKLRNCIFINRKVVLL